MPANLTVQKDPTVLAFPSVAMASKEFASQGRADFASKSFIEIQTAWETAVGNALSGPDADVAGSLKAGADAIRAIIARP